MSAECTVIIPTHDHAALLPYAIRSVWAQTMTDFELVVIGDGVNDDTRAVMKEACRADSRTRFIDRPKSPRTGEQYRHEVLASCESRWVAYCGDDDLLLPYHLEVVGEQLREVDLVHGHGSYVDADGSIGILWTDFGRDEDRRRELGDESLASLTGMAHTMDAYRRLPYGWRTTPVGSYTDHYMYKQFLSDPSMTARVTPIPTCLHFASDQRSTWTTEERVGEMRAWVERLGDDRPGFGVEAAFAAASYAQGVELMVEHRLLAERCADRIVTLEQRVSEIAVERDAERAEREAMERTRTWSIRNRLLRMRDRVRPNH